MPNELKTFIVCLKKGENVRVKAESPVVDGLNGTKFMTGSLIVAKFENAEMLFFYEEGDHVERHVDLEKKPATRSRSKTTSTK